MEKERIRRRLHRVLSTAPELQEIMVSPGPLEEKRSRIREFLSGMLGATFDDDPTIPPLEWILTRDAIEAFRMILSRRSEQLAGFSFLRYLNDLIHRPDYRGLERPTPGFFSELDHLLRGITGRAGIYEKTFLAFTKHTGRKAARMRSADLSRMYRKAQAFMDRYACGLDDDVVRRRSKNKQRILDYFGATELEWEDWHWHTRHIVRSADTLKALVRVTDEEYRAVSLARKYRIPFGITPYYLSLMDHEEDQGLDYAVRAQVIPPVDYVTRMRELKDRSERSMDFMLERDTSPIEGITRRYPSIVILKPILTCPQICVYCQRNWEIEDVYSRTAALSREKQERAIEWIAQTPEISEVLITGGDPLLLSDERIENLLFRLSSIDHVERIRIGTRTPVTLPQRVTDTLVRHINHFHNPGKREILIVTHVEHPYEITPQLLDAVQKFRRYGMEVYNQLVFTFFNSRRFEAAFLRRKLRLAGVTPYYTFNTKGKEETDAYRVPIARLLQEQQEESRLLPGSVRTDEIVFNVPGLGKNYLRARQHHDIISILPDGRRVYEFHPWEKKLELANTYVYTDVSIHDYLRRLKEAGEDPAPYRTIWYYY
ncbi:MAG: KamA family radical SAM protein [Deltaproteobacteria bacterium]|nr:KamA family radical SAM protein [Deltaproteobacteria bacterium]MBW1949323.1 KamA family radical SAM protein [Deltaproteobacteria bacterium]MBW2008325.1 KamA family radical SAM protein [Deltaproteobacteria bacterium]MBW2102086.1 KamA family radical SAM protein [Deltaproteobacteria bacterium]RLB35174.1 MAG: KamA family radical SAM protein [Deltaproteobacteria bacterium]